MVYLALLLQQLISSLTHIVAQGLTAEVDASLAVLLRAVTAVCAYGIWMRLKRRELRIVERRDYPRILILGLLNIPINQFLFLSGMELTIAPNASLMYALSPAFVLILAVLFFGEKARPLKFLGVALAIAGTAIVVFEKGVDFNSAYFRGNLIILCASCSWALYTLLGKDIAVKYGAMHSTSLAMIVGLCLYVPVYSLLPVQSTVADVSLFNWGQLLYLGVITSGAGYALWYYALTKIDASQVSVFNNLQPVLTTILTILIFQVYPSFWFLLGGAIAISGVIITQKA